MPIRHSNSHIVVLSSEPPSELANRLSLIVDNVDVANRSAKANDICSLWNEDEIDHFALYVTVKRELHEGIIFIKTYT